MSCHRCPAGPTVPSSASSSRKNSPRGSTPEGRAYTERVQQVEQTLDVSNDVAAELASIGDGILDALRDRLEITILLRGNPLTITGDDVHVAEAPAVVDQLAEPVQPGQEIRPRTV